MVSAIAIFIIAINVYIYLKNKKDKQDEKRYSRFIKNSRATSTIQIEAVVSSATVSNLKKRKTSKETSISVAYDGTPITDNDREIIKNFLKDYFSNKK